MKCVACGAPLDDDIDLCDECFRVMPVDEMVSASEINDIRQAMS
jgi:NMD protein affecting ribosome stability and mRNA decay